MNSKPNVIFVFADQWRQQATGYAGDPNVRTPNLDALAPRSINFTHAASGCPVCTVYRASLMTGQQPLTHGAFLNDVCLRPNGACVAEVFAEAGYDTAYIGKWHIDGHGRSEPIPPDRRLGFDYWKVLECTHNYRRSAYYEGDSTEKQYWDDYDAFAQTRDAQQYIQNHDTHRPFLLMLSWGPPHGPYRLAPEDYKALYDADALQLRPNVPAHIEAEAREAMVGYYAHCTALDKCVGDLLNTLATTGRDRDTIFIFTSDHGDMLGSQGEMQKQRPWDESVRVPFLLYCPAMPGWRPRESQAPIDAPDIMPTLLGLCDIPIPDHVEGVDYSSHILGGQDPSDGMALITCPHPFGQWNVPEHGGREYRGLRGPGYTYVRDRQGPWLLYDNQHDPYQMHNRVDDPALADVRAELDHELRRRLDEHGDEFRPGMDYVRQWGYPVDATGTMPYTP